MAETNERRKPTRKASATTPKPDTKAAAPRKSTSEQRSSPATAPQSSNVRPELSSEETRRQIAEAAYFRAKERGFEPGHELEDWIEAEAEVMGRLNGERR
jgi:hypothetical protein